MTDVALERMPQKGPMLLLDRIVSMDGDRIRCVARACDGPDHPLRIGGDLETVALIEMGAQAAAAHASIHGVGENHAGLLLALHGIEILGEPDSGALEIEAERVFSTEDAARYRFTVGSVASVCLRGEATMRMQGVGE